MSVVTTRTKSSRNSSILKKTSLKNRISQIVNTPTKVRFTLPHTKKIRNILEEYIATKDRHDYDHLVCTIRDSELFEDDILSLLTESNDCISLLDKKLRLFVEAILTVKWLDFSNDVMSAYQSFVTNLVAAHHEHAKLAVDNLVNLCLETPTEEEWPDGEPTNSDCTRCIKIHTVMHSLISLVPLCGPLLVPSITAKYPYMKRPTHIQEYFLHNLLWLIKYVHPIKTDIMHLIISKLILMDVHIPKEVPSITEEDIFQMDIDERPDKPVMDSQQLVAHTLDVCLDKLYGHLISECYSSTGELDWDNTKDLYKDLLVIFDDIILPTYNSHNVQFLMFFFCSFKQTLAETFINHLWAKVCNPSLAAVLRQTAVTYIASLLARANYIPLTMLKGTLQEMAEWIHSYISNQDGVQCVNTDTKVHLIFYSVCQSLFYLIAFRHKDLVTKKKNIVFLESLNLGKIVTCRLNPLRVCQPAVAQNFAAVTRKYQLAYCYTVMEHNARNTMSTIYHDDRGSVAMFNNLLEGYYPFDPYVLPRSSKKIHQLYRDYQESSDNSSSSKRRKVSCEVDDFLENPLEMSTSSKSYDKFSYGCSPGFKFKT